MPTYHEFLSDMALDLQNEEDIAAVVEGKGEPYRIVEKFPWTLKSQVLATGLASNNKKYVTTLKDGNEKTRQKGHRDMFKGGLDPAAPEWSTFAGLFSPSGDCLGHLPARSLLLRVGLHLDRPFFSRDDRPFYPMDNALKREWVFQVPYLAAAGVKGLLRWAWQACFGDEQMEAETVVFGPRTDKLEENGACRGCARFWPIFWKGQVGVEMLNPQDRDSGAGSNPIKYEVVKKGGTGDLWLLLANTGLRGDFGGFLPHFLEALAFLVEDGGLSAKRSADWGSVSVTACEAWTRGMEASAAPKTKADDKADVWAKVVDESGELKPLSDTAVFTTNILAELTDFSKSRIKKPDQRSAVLDEVRRLWEARRAPVEPAAKAAGDVVAHMECNSLDDLGKRLLTLYGKGEQA